MKVHVTKATPNEGAGVYYPVAEGIHVFQIMEVDAREGNNGPQLMVKVQVIQSQVEQLGKKATLFVATDPNREARNDYMFNGLFRALKAGGLPTEDAVDDAGQQYESFDIENFVGRSFQATVSHGALKQNPKHDADVWVNWRYFKAPTTVAPQTTVPATTQAPVAAAPVAQAAVAPTAVAPTPVQVQPSAVAVAPQAIAPTPVAVRPPGA